MVLGCDPGQETQEIPPPSPGLELSTEDYPTARNRFKTQLTRQGPATPEAHEAVAPPDAVELAYQSGPLTLKAFASPVSSSKTRKSAILFLHGGYEFAEGHWAMTRPFREAGFVVMVPTVRGENGQPGAFSLFHNEVEDVLAAAELLANRPDVDPKHLFIAGHSVGGTLTLLAALASDRFKGAASFSGSPDQVEYTRGRPDRVPFNPSNIEEFRLRSPVVFAAFFRCPVRLYYGEEELWLQPSTHRTALLARKAGRDVESIEVEGGHDSANPEVLRQCIAFFRSL
jgi:dipeptidyl aminopeptidase/acylaminoacyl peptidase